MEDSNFRKGDAKTAIFGSNAMLHPAPVDVIPDGPTTPEIAYQMVKDETYAQTQPRLNLATFVTTWMDDYATKLMNEAININYIDETEYPRIAVMNAKCINIMANLWNSPEQAKWKAGALAIESSEACMLGGVAAWLRWRERRIAQGKPTDKPNFVISAGDQVNKTGKPKEEEYAAYLSADALKSLPVATTIGNHDSLNKDYSYHFNNPNPTDLGMTEAGGDYYYSYGPGLFIVLNTNNYNVAEHEQAIQKAVANFPDTKWRIVTIHQDIYGSGLDHSDTDGMILRTQLTPVFDKYDIDVVLQGHDHTYSRSKILYGDGKSHGSYEFRLDETGLDYDWDHAYNNNTGESITLNPLSSDTAAVEAKDAFTADNKCYTIESSGKSVVTNPKGTLYMTANSASGSKYYELINSQQDYIEVRSQNWLPSYSVIDLTKDDFKITTYQITDEGKVENIDNTFTIHKTVNR